MDNRKKILIIVGVVVLAAVAVGGGFLARKVVEPSQENGTAESEAPMYNGRPVSDLYSPEVPKSASTTESRAVMPASPDPNLSTKNRLYDLSASASGFSPDALTVNAYDTIRINFTAVDGDYDFSIPYLGVSFAPVLKGETKILTFTASGSGTFSFECGNACPSGEKIRGSLVIIPYKGN